MVIQQLLKFSKWTAIVSFIIGTCIFLFYYATSNSNFLFIGFAYIFLAGAVNLFLLILLVIHFFKSKEGKVKILTTSGFILLNIPIVVFYSWITIQLIDTMRITFINPTSTQITDIEIVGCEEKYIAKLNPGETKTVWVHIPRDCSVHINYILNQEKKTQEVTGYCTKGNGIKMRYRIGIDKAFDKNL